MAYKKICKYCDKEIDTLIGTIDVESLISTYNIAHLDCHAKHLNRQVLDKLICLTGVNYNSFVVKTLNYEPAKESSPNCLRIIILTTSHFQELTSNEFKELILHNLEDLLPATPIIRKRRISYCAIKSVKTICDFTHIEYDLSIDF